MSCHQQRPFPNESFVQQNLCLQWLCSSLCSDVVCRMATLVLFWSTRIPLFSWDVDLAWLPYLELPESCWNTRATPWGSPVSYCLLSPRPQYLSLGSGFHLRTLPRCLTVCSSTSKTSERAPQVTYAAPSQLILPLDCSGTFGSVCLSPPPSPIVPFLIFQAHQVVCPALILLHDFPLEHD